MQICYVDESGDTRDLDTATSPIAPVCVILGVVFDQAVLHGLTSEFITLKRNAFPNLPVHPKHLRLAWVLPEIKGADLRRAMRTGEPRRNRRHTIYFLDRFMQLLEDYQAKIFGRVWVKEVGGTCNGQAVFGSSMQALCGYFQQYLEEQDQLGFVIADSRTPTENAAVSMSIFTQKYKVEGDGYDRVLEMPTFGHSQNHVGIQIADLLGSALVFPMATAAYCLGTVQNIHVDPNFGRLIERYGSRLSALQFRYRDENNKRCGGLTVNDRIGQKHSGFLFRPQTSAYFANPS
jgi:hypothetical protein